MWLYVEYEPVTAFGLRPSNTTANGGKTLLCPTPYAIKMALLDRLIRLAGEAETRAHFTQIRDLGFYVQVPLAVAVNRTFQKVLRGWDNKTAKWTSTISQREYCFHTGALALAVEVLADDAVIGLLTQLFSTVNYFGRRGGFMQMVNMAVTEEGPPDTFINLSRTRETQILGGFLQRMDDMMPDAAFDDVSVFNPKAKGARLSYTVSIPYFLVYHGPNHTVYARQEGD